MSLSRVFKSIAPTLKDAFDDDLMTVSRMVEYTKDNGATGHKPDEVYEDIPCHYIQSALTGGDQTISSNNIEYEHKIKYNPEFTIKAGDVISIKIKDTEEIRKFRAGDPILGYARCSCALVFDGKA